jgi:pimeloyl-ACP methyl ester carboxylesterase
MWDPSRLSLFVLLFVGQGVGETQVSLVGAVEAQATPKGVGSELIHVRSKDGTRIGVECAGVGPTILFVHGGVGYRTRWTPMFPLLSAKFTACAMDRRGRGASGDSAEYSLLKEAEDVAAVVDSRQGQVFVLGHSYGGVSSLEATFLTTRITGLMLYEPPLFEPVGPALAVADRIEAMIKAGDLEGALVTFQTEVGKQSAEEIEAMKARPSWSTLVATIPLQPRQMRALARYKFDAGRMKAVRIPTLLLVGEDTASPYIRQSIDRLHETLPNSVLLVLEDQQHNAMDGARDALASAIVDFVSNLN